jgi:ABC-type phosphate transport system permease subunit
MSAALVETLQLVREGAHNASSGPHAAHAATLAATLAAEGGAGKAARALALALGMVLFALCVVLAEWRGWVLRKRELQETEALAGGAGGAGGARWPSA